MRKTLVVLAGGLGSRYQSLKQLDLIQSTGFTLMEYALFDAILNGFSQIILVINETHAEEIQHFVKKIKLPQYVQISLALQGITGYIPKNLLQLAQGRYKPWGTAHAILSAEKLVKTPFVVINADDFYGRNAYRIASKIIDDKKVSKSHFHMVGYQIKETLSKNGTVSRGICRINDGKLHKIEERTAIQLIDNKLISKENGKVHPIPENSIVSMNFWIFHPTVFTSLQKQFITFLSKKPNQNEEFYLPFAVDTLIQDKKAEVAVSISKDKWMGLTYPEDKKQVEKQIDKWIQQNKYPDKLWS